MKTGSRFVKRPQYATDEFTNGLACLLATAATSVVVRSVVVAAAAENYDKKNDPSTATIVSEQTVIITHILSSFRLHYILF